MAPQYESFMMKFSFLVNLIKNAAPQGDFVDVYPNIRAASKLLDLQFIKDQGRQKYRQVGSAVQLSYYRAETTRHMHILDEASIEDEGGRL